MRATISTLSEPFHTSNDAFIKSKLEGVNEIVARRLGNGRRFG